MDKNIQPMALDYLQNLLKLDNPNREQFKKLNNELSNLDENAYIIATGLIYNYQCSIEVSILLYDIVIKQIEFGRRINPNSIFENLSKNQKSQYQFVRPEYEKKIAIINKFNKLNISVLPIKLSSDSENYDEVNDEEDDEEEDDDEEDDEDEYEDDFLVYTPDTKDIEFMNDFLLEKTFSRTETSRIVINDNFVPKSSWMLNVYASSYEDYCFIIQETLQELNDLGTTVLLAKPESFKDKNISVNSPKIAYSIITNEHFKFTSLSEHFVEILDNGPEITIISGKRISQRASIMFVSFIGSYFLNKQGVITSDSQTYIDSFQSDEYILAEIESIGESANTIKQYIELKTGISQGNSIQLYKSILFNKEDVMVIASILRNIDGGKVDFIMDTDKDDIKVLFIHISHLQDVLNEIEKYDLTIEINTEVDELKI